MFGIFKKKTQKQLLQEKYLKLMEDAHRISKSNRKLSYDKVFEAEEVMKEIEKLLG